MCPSPAAVRRYPNVTLMAPAAAATPSLLRPLRPCSNNRTGNFDDKKHYPRLEGQPQISILLPCPTRVLYTGGRILAWTHRSTKEESIRINQFLRRTAAIVSRGGKLTTTERMAERRGEHTRQGTARHGTARNTTCWVPQDLPGGFPVWAMHAASRDTSPRSRLVESLMPEKWRNADAASLLPLRDRLSSSDPPISICV